MAQEIRFSHLTTKDGLSDNTINTIIQDDLGFMWFGTSEGLNRYDGISFKRYFHDEQNSKSLGGNRVKTIYKDKDGELLITTRAGGLSVYHPRTDDFTVYKHLVNDPSSISSNDVYAVIQDGFGRFWIGTSKGIDIFNKKTGKFKRYKSYKNAKTTDGKFGILLDKNGYVWIATSHQEGVLIIDPKREKLIQKITVNNEDESNFITNLLQLPDGNILASSLQKGLIIINSQNYAFHELSKKNSCLKDHFLWAASLDSEQNIWLGAERKGLIKFSLRDNTCANYKYDKYDSNSINTDVVYSIYEDNQGGVWVGGYKSGVNYFSKREFDVFKNINTSNSELSNHNIISIAEDDSGHIWLGTDGGGLHRYDPKSGRIINFPYLPVDHDVPNRDVILSLKELPDNKILLGTYREGGNIFNKNTHSLIQGTNGLPLNFLSEEQVWQIYSDEEGNVLAGTENGVKLFNVDSPELKQGFLSGIGIRVIFEDSFNELWFGTTNGLYRQSSAKLNVTEPIQYVPNENDPYSISHSFIIAIYEDSKHRLWIGTYGGGLNLFDRNTGEFSVFTTSSGLPSDTVTGILEDEKGLLWLSTLKGISRFDSSTKTFRNFSTENGLEGNSFNLNANLRSNSGLFYFGGAEGLTVFNPNNVVKNNSISPVVITQLKLENEIISVSDETQLLTKDIAFTKSITLDYKENIIGFEFAMLNFLYPKLNKYAYKMVGFDENWVHVGAKHEATYTNLDPGEYVFHVKASNNDGIWNEEGTSIRIVIQPPPWKTWWAYSFYILLIAGLTYLFIRGQREKVHQAREISKELELKVSERTVELAKQKNEIENKNTELESKNRELALQTKEMELKNKEILEAQQQLVQSSKMASLGTMTAGIAHEINNPTNFTHAAVYMMHDEIKEIKRFLTQLAGGENADVKVLESFDEKFNTLVELANTANEGTARIKTIVGELRTFARLEDSQQEEVAISELVSSTIKLVNTQFDTINISFDVKYNPSLKCFPSKLKQVFMNILINACQAILQRQLTESDLEGGIEICSDGGGHELVVSFKDNGAGMTEQTMKRIFEPFYTTKEVGTGTGLGMAISFGIIEEHCGTISVSSILGEGTEIVVEFTL